MKLRSLLLLAVVTSGHYVDNNVNYVSQSYFLCQQWCYRFDNFGSIFLTCCDMTVRHGNCPKGCLFGYGANIRQIVCQVDGNCPIGYKCCPDQCSYFQKLCKPIVFQTICEAPPSPPPLVTTKTPHTCPTLPVTTATESPSTQEITTTESNSGELPTVVYSGSGDDDGDDGDDDDWEFVTESTIRDVQTESTMVEEETESTTDVVEESTILEEQTETTTEVVEESTILEEQTETTTEVVEESTVREEETETALNSQEVTTIREETETTPNIEEETTTRELQPETTINLEEGETTTIDILSGSGSGSGDGDDDEKNILPPVADQPYADDDDFFYEQP